MAMRIRTTIVLGLIVAFASALAASPAKAAQELDWRFEVSLDDRKIGYHSFSLEQRAGRQILETEARFDVKLLFITAFKYRHSNTEVWDDGCIESMDARTRTNGKVLEVTAERNAQMLEVSSTNGKAELGACVQSFAYWNPRILEAERLLNSQTGEYESVSVTQEGSDIVDVNGRALDAVRYTLATKAGEIKLWYSKDSEYWLALEAPAKGGRTIRYTPVAVPEQPLVQAAASVRI